MDPTELGREIDLHPELLDLRGRSADEIRHLLGLPTRIEAGDQKLLEWWDDERRDKVAAYAMWEYAGILQAGVVEVFFLPSEVVAQVHFLPRPSPATS